MIGNLRKYALAAFILVLSSTIVVAQEVNDSQAELSKQTDIKDVIKGILKGGRYHDSVRKVSNFSILPFASYNPSIGLQIGVTATGGKIFGDPATTRFSVYNANAYITTLGLYAAEIKENIFTSNSLYNIQGGIQAGQTVALDYGVGTGRPEQGDGSFSINSFPLANNPDVFPIQYTYAKLTERIYRKIVKNVYAGAGVVLDLYSNIDDERRLGPNISTHNYRYSKLNGFPTDNYAADGLLLNFEYNSRDQTNRPYKGLYIDLVLRFNETWMGSNREAMQLKTELRKYFSLSKKKPQNVLAFWLWGSYLLRGAIPYLELPGTGSDAAGRLGRGYTIGRFKGTSFFYSEGEYRFTFTENKLFGGVVFANMESASNQQKIRLMEYLEPGAGAGLRFLFNKYSRSNLCLDYGRGNYGSNGIFLGFNEVF